MSIENKMLDNHNDIYGRTASYFERKKLTEKKNENL